MAQQRTVSVVRNGQGKGSAFGSGGQEGHLWKGNVCPKAAMRGSECSTWCVWGAARRSVWLQLGEGEAMRSHWSPRGQTASAEYRPWEASGGFEQVMS